VTCILAVAFAPVSANAKGCIKGAIVGGAAGHLAHHTLLGAAAGCVIGHHEAVKAEKAQQQQQNQQEQMQPLSPTPAQAPTKQQ
jgi:outer membrane lipoprotein SlyB